MGCRGASKSGAGRSPSEAASAGSGGSSAGETAAPEGGEAGSVDRGGRGGTGGRPRPAGGGGAGGVGASAGNGGGSSTGGAGQGGDGSGGRGAVSGLGGSAGRSSHPPVGWRCDASRYADGVSCDCGCGVVDADCNDATTASCDSCDTPGACAPGACPGKLQPDDNAACEAPAKWSCAPELYYDGTCNCGCGVTDVDCPSSDVDVCTACPTSSCAPFDCAALASDNALCSRPPFAWRCAPELYGDGSECDCGCGYLDPDCSGNDLGACEVCNAEGSCDGQACPGTIDPTRVEYCTHPAPPAEWTCDDAQYADGLNCECGCGAPDPDCRTPKVDSCDRCQACTTYGCARIDLTDTTRCLPPPKGWTCNANRYEDTLCDCGCGIKDPDCTIPLPGYCNSCPEESCAHGDCQKVDPADETRCK
jgi:hypothetical protein